MKRDQFYPFAQSHFARLLLIFFLTALAYFNIFPNRFMSFEIGVQISGLGGLHFDHLGVSDFGKRLAQEISERLGSGVFSFHLFSLFLHLTNIFIVYKIAYKITQEKWIAFLTGLFFALHPVQTEAVTPISNFIVLLGSLTLFGAMYWYIKSKEKKIYLMFACVLTLVAILIDRQALVLPFMILAYEYFCHKEKFFNQTTLKIFVFLCFIAAVGFCFNAFVSPVSEGYFKDSFYLNFLTAVKALGQYVGLAIFPLILSYNHAVAPGIYSRFPEDFDSFAFLSQSLIDLHTLTAILILGVAGFMVKRIGKKNGWVYLGSAWFFIFLIPVLSFWPTRIYLSESFLYVSIFGYALALAAICAETYKKSADVLAWSRVLTIFFIVFVVSFSLTRIWLRNLEWFNDVTLYRSTVQTNAESLLMKKKLTAAYIKFRMPDEAMKTLALIPEKDFDSSLYVLKAQAYSGLNQFKKVITTFDKAIRLDPENADAYFRLSEVYAMWDMIEPAQENLDRAVFYFKKQGRFREADRIEKILIDFDQLPEQVQETNP